MREFDSNFENALRRAFANDERGPCPSDEGLVAFYEGRLSSDEAAKVGAHLERCGVCDALVYRLRRPDIGIAATSEQKNRIRQRVFSEKRSVRDSIKNLLKSPLPGYAFAAAFAAILAFRIAIPQENKEQTAFGDAVELELTQVRGADGAHGGASTRGKRYLILRFFVPVDPAKQYWVSLDGKPANECSSYDRLGNFRLVIPAKSLPATTNALHRLDIEERSQQSVLQSWQFQFTLSENHGDR